MIDNFYMLLLATVYIFCSATSLERTWSKHYIQFHDPSYTKRNEGCLHPAPFQIRRRPNRSQLLEAYSADVIIFEGAIIAVRSWRDPAR
jgi:hypothetical protein